MATPGVKRSAAHAQLDEILSLLRGGGAGEEGAAGDGAAARLVELDGTKRCAIDHGAVEELAALHEGGAGVCNSFLSAAAVVIRKRFMEVDPSNIQFSLMCLCEVGEGWTEGEQWG